MFTTHMRYLTASLLVALCASCGPIWYIARLNTETLMPSSRVRTAHDGNDPSMSIGADVTLTPERELQASDDDIPDQPVYDESGAFVGWIPYDGYNLHWYMPRSRLGLSVDTRLNRWLDLFGEAQYRWYDHDHLFALQTGLGVELPLGPVAARLDNSFRCSRMHYDLLMRSDETVPRERTESGYVWSPGYSLDVTFSTTRDRLWLRYYLHGGFTFSKTTIAVEDEDTEFSLATLSVGGGLLKRIGAVTLLAGARAVFPKTGYEHTPRAWAQVDVQAEWKWGLPRLAAALDSNRVRHLRRRGYAPNACDTACPSLGCCDSALQRCVPRIPLSGRQGCACVDDSVCPHDAICFAGRCTEREWVRRAGNFNLWPGTILSGGGIAASVVSAVAGLEESYCKPTDDGSEWSGYERYEIDGSHLAGHRVGFPAYVGGGLATQLTTVQQSIYLRELGVIPPKGLLCASWLLYGISIVTGGTMELVGAHTVDAVYEQPRDTPETPDHYVACLVTHIPVALASYLLTTATYVKQRHMLSSAVEKRPHHRPAQSRLSILPCLAWTGDRGYAGIAVGF